MIPIRDINPTRRFPLVTVGIIVLNILVFAFEFLLPVDTLEALVSTWGLTPYRLANLETLAFVTVFTSMFLHSGFTHLIGNMLYLWIFGDNIEAALGSSRFVLFYLLCGIGAAVGQILVAPRSTIPMVGASGAISGIMGGYLFLYPRAEVETLVFLGYFIRLIKLPTTVVLGSWIVLQLFSGVMSLGMQAAGGVAWFAHVGGFAFGYLYFRLTKKRVNRVRVE